MYTIKFIPQTPYATPLRSDTLFGIICWGARWIYGAELLGEWLADFQKGSPPFLISSAFPFQDKNGTTQYYLPKPALPLPRIKNGDNQKIKDLRKLQYLTLEDFLTIVNGQQSLWDLFSRKTQYETLKAVSDLLTYNRFDRLSWNTLGKQGQVYQEPIYYFPHAEQNVTKGLYVWLQGSPEVIAKLKAVWRYWEDVGIGKNASIGLGKFQIELCDAPALILPSNPTHQITLSLYNPTESELQHFRRQRDRFWYQLAIRKGRIGGVVFTSPNPFKPKVPQLSEGSVFPNLEQPYYGKVTLIANREHPIYHYGYALTFPAQIKETQS